jgi:hypothetical protein
MAQMHSQPSTNTVAKKVNHTSHCHQPSQSSSSNQPSYQNFSPRPEYQSHYQRYPSQYYQPYNYTPHTNQVHSPQPTITYPPAPLQIMYQAASSQATQPKIEPKNPPHLHHKTKILLNKPPVSQPSELYTLSPEAPT